jgi:nucleoside-diphosphate-sugar epimerase
MNPVWVTGANGFLGRAVVAALCAVPGSDVRPVTRRPSEDPTTLSIRRYSDIDAPLPGTVLHLAEPPLLPTRDAGSLIEEARSALRTLLDRATGRLIYASSVVVYGDRSHEARTPDAEREPRGPYAEMKARHEDMVLAAGGTVLRLTNLIGVGMSAGTVIGDVMAQLGEEGPIKIRSLSPVRDYLSVDDAATAFAAAADVPYKGALNVATGNSISVQDLTRRLLKAANQPNRRIEGGTNGGPSAIHLDISATRSVLGWTPSDQLDETLSLIAERRQFNTTG